MNWSGRERDCFIQGRRDRQCGRGEQAHDRHSDDSCDRAYFRGREAERDAEESRKDEENELAQQEQEYYEQQERERQEHEITETEVE